MPLSTDQILNNRYRIVKLLGQGGMGAVYRAWDLNLQKACAVKENLDISPGAQTQFQREAKILSNLNNPNLVRVTDYFSLPGQGQYLVMDYAEGDDLQTMLRASASGEHRYASSAGQPPPYLPESQVLTWIRQVCEALTYIHSQNPPVIHRDIKPANIRINPQGQAILVDFGISKFYDPNQLTTMGARAVTPGYSPQEQYGAGHTDARSDIYALGATLYTLLTGQIPVESVQRSVTPLVPPRQWNPSISSEVEAAILKAMEIAPTQRYASAADFKLALSYHRPVQMSSPGSTTFAPIAAAPTQAQPVTPIGAQRRISAWMIAVAVLVLFVCGGLGAFFLGQLLSPSEKKQDASPSPIARTQTVIPSATSDISSLATSTGPPEISPTPIIETTLLPQFTAPPLYPSPTTVIALTPPPLSGETRLNPNDGAGMVYVPAGDFSMGMTPEQAQYLLSICKGCKSTVYDASQPANQVYLEAYWIYQTEVTNRMYKNCEKAGACPAPSRKSSDSRSNYYGNSTYDNYPVIYVDWFSADKYCTWAGGRLPTAAEWEKAARGTDGRLFPWGNAAPDGNLANFNSLFGDTTEVGSFPGGASPYNALDLAGNVWEWVADWFERDYYSSSPSNNPQGPLNSSINWRSGRGGQAFMSAGEISPAFNDGWEPNEIGSAVGFRCASTGNP
jgi:serine/threonine protein kinase